MPVLGISSRQKLQNVHPDLIRVLDAVVRRYDCKVIEGWRSYEAQQAAHDAGKSELPPGQSWHNGWRHVSGNIWAPDPKGLSLAVDVSPYPIIWEDIPRFHRFACFVLGVAHAMGVPLRWGGDWNGNWDLTDQKLHDCPHFELAGMVKQL